MTLLKNLTYKIKRFFRGEFGIVERVEPQDPLDKNNYLKDNDGNLPKRIFVRNPIGELVEMNNQMILEPRYTFKGREYCYFKVYKDHEIGDKFP